MMQQPDKSPSPVSLCPAKFRSTKGIAGNILKIMRGIAPLSAVE
jgi:hypothetical protein